MTRRIYLTEECVKRLQKGKSEIVRLPDGEEFEFIWAKEGPTRIDDAPRSTLRGDGPYVEVKP